MKSLQSSCKSLLLPSHRKWTTMPRDFCAIQCITQASLDHPKKTAIRSDQQEYTYAALVQYVEKLADQIQELLKSISLQRNKPLVAIYSQSNEIMVIAILAVMKVKAVFIPLSMDSPHQRVEEVLEDCAPDIILSGIEAIRFKQYAACREVADLLPMKQIYCAVQHPASNIPPNKSSYPNFSGDTAYLLYTSGSSGKPKGVVVKRQSLDHFLFHMTQLLSIDTRSKLLSITSPSFDIYLLEILAPLMRGAELNIAMPEVISDPENILMLLIEHEITILQATPSIWTLITRFVTDVQCSILKNQLLGLCGGEPISEELLPKLQKMTQESILLYGPTETTIWSCTFKLSEAINLKMNDAIIGTPIGNQCCYVVNEQGGLVEQNVVGELCVSGSGVAEGYYDDLDKTAARFINNPFVTYEPDLSTGHEMLYKTGDLAKISNGVLVFISRLDRQIKIRGNRVELGDVEHGLLSYPGIKQCAVILHEDTSTKEKILVAYYITDAEALDHSRLSKFLLKKLPNHMIPRFFNYVNELPLNARGKIDYHALEERFTLHSNTEKPITKPVTAEENKIHEIFCKALGIKNMGIHVDFFEAGGYSLLIPEIILAINSHYSVAMTIRVFNKLRTIHEIANMIHQEVNNNEQKIA